MNEKRRNTAVDNLLSWESAVNRIQLTMLPIIPPMNIGKPTEASRTRAANAKRAASSAGYAIVGKIVPCRSQRQCCWRLLPIHILNNPCFDFQSLIPFFWQKQVIRRVVSALTSMSPSDNNRLRGVLSQDSFPLRTHEDEIWTTSICYCVGWHSIGIFSGDISRLPKWILDKRFSRCVIEPLFQMCLQWYDCIQRMSHRSACRSLTQLRRRVLPMVYKYQHFAVKYR